MAASDCRASRSRLLRFCDACRYSPVAFPGCCVLGQERKPTFDFILGGKQDLLLKVLLVVQFPGTQGLASPGTSTQPGLLAPGMEREGPAWAWKGGGGLGSWWEGKGGRPGMGKGVEGERVQWVCKMGFLAQRIA